MEMKLFSNTVCSGYKYRSGRGWCWAMIGIEDITAYVPKLFISTTGEFASIRGIEPAKLSRGIGVRKMAIPDAHEDAATMGAMSLLGLMERNRLLPRIYWQDIHWNNECARERGQLAGGFGKSR